MTLSLELMDWIKLFMILSALIGNAVWIMRTVKELKEDYKNIDNKITTIHDEFQKLAKDIRTELKKDITELKQELSSKQESLDRKLEELQEHHNKQLQNLQEKHYQFREEVAVNFLKRDEWFILHNKLEAKLEKKFDKLEELIIEVKK